MIDLNFAEEPAPLPPAAVAMSRLDRERRRAERALAEECPIAFSYDGTSLAVVMATPADLSDLAVGFSLTEGIVQSPLEIEQLDIVSHIGGIEIRTWLSAESGRQFRARQRRMVGPTGCGLCGIEHLSEAARPLPQLKRHISLGAEQIESAVATLSNLQSLNRLTRATHAAGFYLPEKGLIRLREDVGRHNALDKLAGALAAEGLAGATGAVILTSRVSVEMVQKTAALGCCFVIAISAPTALAVRTAEACGITLIGIVRGGSFEIFSHAEGVTCD
jgi:FdhD protein